MIRQKRLRIIILISSIIFPWPIKRLLLKYFLGYKLSKTSRIGFSIVEADEVLMKDNSKIGHLTICRSLLSLNIGEFSSIGNLNWITGGSKRHLKSKMANANPESRLSIGKHSAITNRHYIDCSDVINIGNYTTVAGVKSQFFTHSINLKTCIQETSPISVGNYCFVGTSTVLLSGSCLPDFSVLSAGSVLKSTYTNKWTIYSGNPATAQKNIDRNSV